MNRDDWFISVLPHHREILTLLSVCLGLDITIKETDFLLCIMEHKLKVKQEVFHDNLKNFSQGRL